MNAIVVLDQLEASKDPALTYLASLGKSSRRVMRTALNNIAQIGGVSWDQMAWETLQPGHTQMIRSKLEETYPAKTANRHLAALRGVLKECWRLGLMSAEEYHRCVDLKSIKGENLPAGRDLDDTEIRILLLDAMDEKKIIGTRDASIIAILYLNGLRRSELTKLTLADYKDGALTINGKGKKQRLAYVKNKGANLLGRWIKARGDEPGALFCPIDKHGNVRIGHMSDQAIYNMLKRRGNRLGIEDFSPHDFRRTNVGNMLDAGVDISTASKIAGHSSIETTRLYDRRPKRVQEEAVAKLDLPI